MDSALLQDRISKGSGIAARKLGATSDAFRPTGTDSPVSPAYRYLRLATSFNAEDPAYQRPNGYGRASWYGVFDTAYTQPGDYLSGPAGVFFIAAQQSLLPVLCVQTNSTLTVLRPAAPTAPGVNAYGGLTQATAGTLISGWPASVLASGGGQGTGVDLPGDTRVPFWSVLLPPSVPVALRSADLLIDDAGRGFTVSSAEHTDLGWRLQVKQATT